MVSREQTTTNKKIAATIAAACAQADAGDWCRTNAMVETVAPSTIRLGTAGVYEGTRRTEAEDSHQWVCCAPWRARSVIHPLRRWSGQGQLSSEQHDLEIQEGDTYDGQHRPPRSTKSIGHRVKTGCRPAKISNGQQSGRASEQPTRNASRWERSVTFSARTT